MKKIFYSIIIIGLVFFTSCRSDQFSCIGSGVKAVSRCCNSINEIKNVFKPDHLKIKEDVKDAGQLNDTPSPVYIWDTKMIIL